MVTTIRGQPNPPDTVEGKSLSTADDQTISTKVPVQEKLQNDGASREVTPTNLLSDDGPLYEMRETAAVRRINADGNELPFVEYDDETRERRKTLTTKCHRGAAEKSVVRVGIKDYMSVTR